MLIMAKISLRMVHSTLNGIAVSVWFVFSTSVVLHAGLDDKLRHMKMNKMVRNEVNRRW